VARFESIHRAAKAARLPRGCSSQKQPLRAARRPIDACLDAGVRRCVTETSKPRLPSAALFDVLRFPLDRRQSSEMRAMRERLPRRWGVGRSRARYLL
jgi:hypothetical protein